MALEGMQLGHYRLVRLIGSGGMGEVYLAEDTRITRRVAIKVVRNEADPYPNTESTHEALRLFEREMRAITTLDHTNILPLIDFGEERVNNAVLTYMVMPFRAEGSLVDWLHAQGGTTTLPPQDVVHIVLQAANALQHAHNQHLMHLDVKPSNFLIRRREDTPNRPDLLLADFGISKFNSATATASQSIRGTPAYMAPEQWAGTPVAATDQYALAIMTYQLLTGRSPFEGNMQRVMYQHLQEVPQPPSSFNAQIPKSVDGVLLRALAKKPEDRYPSIAAFATAFEQACQSRAIPVPPPPPTAYGYSGPPAPAEYGYPAPPPPTPAPKKLNTAMIAAIIGLLVIVIVGGGLAFALSYHPSSNNSNSNSGSQDTPTATSSGSQDTPTATSGDTFPTLHSSYSGTSLASGVNSDLTLDSVVEDQQGGITGNLTFVVTNSTCSFTGAVTTSNNITFKCTFSNNQIYDFTGTVFASTDDHIEGTYVQETSTSDTGTWNVSPS